MPRAVGISPALVDVVGLAKSTSSGRERRSRWPSTGTSSRPSAGTGFRHAAACVALLLMLAARSPRRFPSRRSAAFADVDSLATDVDALARGASARTQPVSRPAALLCRCPLRRGSTPWAGRQCSRVRGRLGCGVLVLGARLWRRSRARRLTRAESSGRREWQILSSLRGGWAYGDRATRRVETRPVAGDDGVG